MVLNVSDMNISHNIFHGKIIDKIQIKKLLAALQTCQYSIAGAYLRDVRHLHPGCTPSSPGIGSVSDKDGAHPGRASNGCRKEMQKTSGKEENSILYFREHT